MLHRRLVFALGFGAALISSQTAQAAAPAERVTVAPADAVPGHAGVTYEALLRKVMPGLVREAGGVWRAPEVPGLRDTDGTVLADSSLAFKDVEALNVTVAGRAILLLLASDSEDEGGFISVLAAFDLTPAAPALLDVAQVGIDRFTDLGATLTLASDTDAFTVTGWHLNAGENYEGAQLYFLKDGKLAPIAFQLAYSVLTCGWETRQTMARTTEAGAPYNAITLSVTETTTLTGEDCGDDQIPPKAGTATYSDVYRWNAKTGAFETTTQNLGKALGPG